jgi:hypothetical protein
MAVTPVAHPITQCLHCNGPVFDNLIVTKCEHIFHKTCLEDWFKHKQTCPFDQRVISLIDCTLFQISFSIDSAVDEKFVTSTLLETLKIQAENACAICHEEFAVYFIQENKGFTHTKCWDEQHPNETSSHPSLYPQQIATVERKWLESGRPSKLPSPAALPALPSSAMGPAQSPRKPSKPISTPLLALLAITPIVSIWAFLMNTRVYKNSNPFLFVLSIPALITLKILSFVSFLFKRIFTERNA